jgi:hypothetical protein
MLGAFVLYPDYLFTVSLGVDFFVMPGNEANL